MGEDISILSLQEKKLPTEVQTDNAFQPFMGDYQVYVSHAVGWSEECLLFLSKYCPRTVNT